MKQKENFKQRSITNEEWDLIESMRNYRRTYPKSNSLFVLIMELVYRLLGTED